MESIPYKIEPASPAGIRLIVGKPEDENPLDKRKLRLPLNIMRVGQSLFFHYAEMFEWQWRDARAMARRYNNRFDDDMFAIVKHKTYLEIVRIR